MKLLFLSNFIIINSININKLFKKCNRYNLCICYTQNDFEKPQFIINTLSLSQTKI